ncbi:MAG: cation:proton antiporter subunit C [Defluviitaleaceae bacterium]|nr:cation:proton antiporter subunit C [Defluviitaleaceae bacterium]
MDWLTTDVVSIILFFIGLAGLVIRKNMMISVVSVGIMDTAIILFFISITSSAGRVAPMMAEYANQSVDPVGHALVLTSIVIGVSIMALILIMILNLYRNYGTLDWDVAKRIREGECHDFDIVKARIEV